MPEELSEKPSGQNGLLTTPGSIYDRLRWEACGEPEIICHDDGDCGGCMHIGPDVEERVCEICGRDEPAEDTDECPDCKLPVWWVPKCPDCGKPATWTYGEIKPMEFQEIQSNDESRNPETTKGEL